MIRSRAMWAISVMSATSCHGDVAATRNVAAPVMKAQGAIAVPAVPAPKPSPAPDEFERIAADILDGSAVAYSEAGAIMTAETRRGGGGIETAVSIQTAGRRVGAGPHTDSTRTLVLDFEARDDEAPSAIKAVAEALRKNKFSSTTLKSWDCFSNECALWPEYYVFFKLNTVFFQFKNANLRKLQKGESYGPGERQWVKSIGTYHSSTGVRAELVRMWANPSIGVMAATFERVPKDGDKIGSGQTTVHCSDLSPAAVE
jgi:hypothetical protein